MGESRMTVHISLLCRVDDRPNERAYSNLTVELPENYTEEHLLAHRLVVWNRLWRFMGGIPIAQESVK